MDTANHLKTPQAAFPMARLGATQLAAHAPDAFAGIIFDLDGTLIDSMPWWEDLGENYLIKRGCTPHPDIRFHFKRLTLEGSAAYMKREYDLPESEAEIANGIMAGIVDGYREHIPLKPGVAEALAAFAEAGVRMCVATATERPCAQAVLDRLGIAQHFSALFTCSEVGASKTDPLIFELALHHLGTPREGTLVFEDSLHAIETARAAGFPTVAVSEPSSAADEAAIRALATAYLDSFSLVK